MQPGILRSILKPSRAAATSMSAADAVKAHADPDTVFIDVRNPDELAASGTIRGAVRAPLRELDRHARPDGGGALPAVSKNKRLMIVCASGARSGVAANRLVAMGYGNVVNIGGFSGWARAGGPTER